MVCARRRRQRYSAGEWARNRVRVFPDPKTGLIQIEWREDGRRRSRSLGHRDWARAERQADEVAAGRNRAHVPKAVEAEPAPLNYSEYEAVLEVSVGMDWRFRVALVIAHETGHRIRALRKRCVSMLPLTKSKLQHKTSSGRPRQLTGMSGCRCIPSGPVPVWLRPMISSLMRLCRVAAPNPQVGLEIEGSAFLRRLSGA